jgi:hypothetical protein
MASSDGLVAVVQEAGEVQEVAPATKPAGLGHRTPSATYRSALAG